VRVGSDQRVGHRDAVLHADDLAEVLEVDLVADTGARRHHAEVVERLLRPSQQRVSLAVAPVLPFDVRQVRPRRAKQVHLHGVVDHEVDVDVRVHPRRVAAGPRHRAAHRGEVDDGRHPREVLHQHAGRHERHGRVRRCVRPGREGLDVLVGDVSRAGPPQQVLEQDLDGVRQPRDASRALLREPRQTPDVRSVATERRSSAGELGAHRVDPGNVLTRSSSHTRRRA
jgi:hypothetical protein